MPAPGPSWHDFEKGRRSLAARPSRKGGGMTKWYLSRRSLLGGAAGSVLAGGLLGRARGAHAAGKLSVGFWDH